MTKNVSLDAKAINKLTPGAWVWVGGIGLPPRRFRVRP